MITGRINAFRFIKRPESIGFCAFFSDRISPIKEIIAKNSATIKLFDSHPKFCPKDGMHNTKLKNIITKIAPLLSKSFNFFGVYKVFG